MIEGPKTVAKMSNSETDSTDSESDSQESSEISICDNEDLKATIAKTLKERHRHGSGVQVDQIKDSHVENIGDKISIASLHLEVNGNESLKLSRIASTESITKLDACVFSDLQKYLIDKYSNQLSILTPISWCSTYRHEMKNIFTKLHLKTTNRYFKLVEDAKIQFEDIFNPNHRSLPWKDLISILIEGASGYGKTTLASKIAYDWATKFGEQDSNLNYLSKFSIVIIIALRKYQVEDIEDYLFQEVFPHEFNNKKKRKSIMRSFMKENDKVLFILDGYDELKGDAIKASLLQLLDRRFFPKCSIILTSQPNQIHDILEYFNLRLKIVGYDSEDVEAYIHNHFQDNEKACANLLNVIHQDDCDNIYKQFSPCPLLLLLLCIMAEEKGGVLPYKATDVLQELVRCIIKRSASKNGKNVNDPFEKYKNTLISLGSLSFKAIIIGQGFLSQYELNEMQLLEELNDLGLFYKTSSASVTGTTNVYEPLNKIFIDFLAAIYLKFSINDEQLTSRNLDLLFLAPNSITFLLTFLSGLLAYDAHKLFDNLPQDLFIDQPKKTFVILRESTNCIKNMDSIQRLLPQKKAVINGEDVVVSGWLDILNAPNCEVSEIFLEIYNHNCCHNNSLKLYETIGRYSKLQNLELWIDFKDECRQETSNNVADLIKNVSKLSSLITFKLFISEIDTQETNSFNCINDSLCHLLKNSKCLSEIDLKIDIGHKQIVSIVDAIITSKKVNDVTLSFLCCSKASLQYLSKLLVFKKRPLRLNLENLHEIYSGKNFQRSLSLDSEESCPENDEFCEAHENGFHIFIQTLSNPLCNIQSLNLSNSNCSIIEYHCFKLALRSNKSLKELVWHDINKFFQIKEILYVLSTNVILQSLDLSSNFVVIEDEDMSELQKIFSKRSVIRLKSFTFAEWRYCFSKKQSLKTLLHLHRSFKYLDEVDIHDSVVQLNFEIGDLFKILKNHKDPLDTKSWFCIDGLRAEVCRPKRMLSTVDFFPLIMQFPASRYSVSCNRTNMSITDARFSRVFKVISKSHNLEELTIQKWKISLNQPEKSFKEIKDSPCHNKLSTLDISDLEICDGDGNCIIGSFVACLINAFKSLKLLYLSVDILTVDNCKEIVSSILKDSSSKDFTIGYSCMNSMLSNSYYGEDVPSRLNEGRVQNLIEAVDKVNLDYDIDYDSRKIKINNKKPFRFCSLPFVSKLFS